MPAQASSQSGPTPITWKRGEFHTFYAQMKIRVGADKGHDPFDIEKGDEFEYDGSICRYAGREVPQPQMRSAVKAGWATLDPEGRSPAAFVAVRDVARSQSKTTDLSRVQRAGARVMESDSLDEQTVLEVGDRNRSMDAQGRHQAPRIVTAADNRRDDHKPGTFRGLEVTQSDIDEQDATPIGRISSPAKLKVDMIANPGVTHQINARTHEQGFGRFNGQRRERTVEREGVVITTNVGDVDRDVRPDGTSEGKVVGKVRRTETRKSSEGVTVEDTSGPRIGRKAAKAEAPAKAAPAKAAAPRPVPAPRAAPKLPPDASPKLKMAVRLDPEFPTDWNFFASANDKLARIKKLGSGPRLLDALYATESAPMKKVLEQKFSSHFA